MHAAAAVVVRRRRHRRRLPRVRARSGARASARAKVAAAAVVIARGTDREPVVHRRTACSRRRRGSRSTRRATCTVRRDERGLRSRRRAAARLRGDEPGRLGLRAADHARRPPGVAVDRRTVHPHVRLLPGDRRRDRAGRHEPTSAPRPCRSRRSRSPRPRGAGLFEQEIASRPLPARPVGDGRVGRARPAPVRRRRRSAATRSTSR